MHFLCLYIVILISLYGGIIMRKSVLCVIIASAAIAMSLTGCDNTDPFLLDNCPATIEITTSRGKAAIVKSVNAAYGKSGLERAKEESIKLNLEAEETANIHFHCDTCGYDTTETISVPYDRVFHCECPKELDSENYREYIEILASK